MVFSTVLYGLLVSDGNATCDKCAFQFATALFVGDIFVFCGLSFLLECGAGCVPYDRRNGGGCVLHRLCQINPGCHAGARQG